MWKLTFLLFVNSIMFMDCIEIPFPNKCKFDDTECLTKTAQAFLPQFVVGMPELGVEVLDPLFIKRIDASTAGLKLIAKDVTILGFKGTQLKEIKFDKSFKTLKIKLLVDLHLSGQHDTSGNILVMPIVGKGPLFVTLRKIEVTVYVNVSRVKEGDKTYFSAEFKDFSYKLKDKADVIFDNLFEGNEVLASATKEMLHQSANEVVLGIGSPFVKAVIDAIIVRINELLKCFQADDIYIH
ncbi:uncharacterized protein LOC121733633 [Aricia agestis]|uniref:uncharacterized protein LOC121733633 n=1 Tax=Aricia agestis TaxID=91739 RepID=UPI001C207036|nr:uncharacterized protein LOC121733633 [Aricia agestis]